MLRLFGTLTSPFVRRVRIVADELGVPSTLHDTNDAETAAQMRALSPIAKVPVAIWRGQTILDSHAITERLMVDCGPGPLLPYDPRDVAATNAIAVADGAADALINVLYLARDGITPEQSPYLRKQIERAGTALEWHDARVGPSPSAGFGLVEIALLTALEWMRFRGTYPKGQHPNLIAFLALHADRKSVVNTRPPA